MLGGNKSKTINEIVDDMTDTYVKGDYIKGITRTGDDALMGPEEFAKRFESVCIGFGYTRAEIRSHKNEIEQWCRYYLGHLESKFQ